MRVALYFYPQFHLPRRVVKLVLHRVDIVQRSQTLTLPIAKQGADIPDGIRRANGGSSAHGLVEHVLLHAK